MQIVVVIAGVVVVIVVSVGLRELYYWLRSDRAILVHPEEVHLEVGGKGDLLIWISRKRARSSVYHPVPGQRTVELTDGRPIFLGPGSVVANNGLAVAKLEGVTPGTRTLTIKAPSNQPDRVYGPTDATVHVYSSGRVPAGVTLTPQYDLVIQPGAVPTDDGE
jgi:hypothetical protein